MTNERPVSPNLNPGATRIRYRIRFAKTGLLRWISHRDLATLWERLGRRARLPFSMTEGFHPKPRIAFPSALALGVEGLDEVVEIDLREPLPEDDLRGRLNDDGQPGLNIHRVTRLPDGFGKAQLIRSDYIITVPQADDLEATRSAIVGLLERDTVSVERKKKTVDANVAEQIPRLELQGINAELHDGVSIDPDRHANHVLHLSLMASKTASLRPDDVLQLLQRSWWTEQGATISRTRVVLDHEPERPQQPEPSEQPEPPDTSQPQSEHTLPPASMSSRFS